MMMLKRKLMNGGSEGESQLPITGSRGAKVARTLQDYVQDYMEPNIRKWVREAVDHAINPYLRASGNQIECPCPCPCPESRAYKLQFHGDLPHTLFTNSRVLSHDKSPIKIALYDSCSNKVVESGPLSSIRVNIVALDGDFGSDDREDWEKKDFGRKVLQNREGKRPLLTGELVVQLKDGVGYIGEISFTDNSRWIRSGKFRLGVSNSDEIRVREGVTNAFKVKDHRGESYQKHYPPSLDDEVWRLEKIAKDGVSHSRLAQFGLSSVKDFLRAYFTNMSSLRAVLDNISNRTWETIIRHATTCRLDNEVYMYWTVSGTGLLFDSIHRAVGVSSDGQTFHSLDFNNAYEMRLVEDLKQHAYKNLQDWIQVDDPSTVGFPVLSTSLGAGGVSNPSLDFQGRTFPTELDQLIMTINPDHPTISPPLNCQVEQGCSSFENHLGERSHQMRVKSAVNDPFWGFNTLALGDNYFVPQFSADDLPVDDNYQVESSAWHENGLLVASKNHQIISSNSQIHVARNWNSKVSWCKILTVVKWRILAKRNAAARKWEHYLCNYLWV